MTITSSLHTSMSHPLRMTTTMSTMQPRVSRMWEKKMMLTIVMTEMKT